MFNLALNSQNTSTSKLVLSGQGLLVPKERLTPIPSSVKSFYGELGLDVPDYDITQLRQLGSTTNVLVKALSAMCQQVEKEAEYTIYGHPSCLKYLSQKMIDF